MSRTPEEKKEARRRRRALRKQGGSREHPDQLPLELVAPNAAKQLDQLDRQIEILAALVDAVTFGNGALNMSTRLHSWTLIVKPTKSEALFANDIFKRLNKGLGSTLLKQYITALDSPPVKKRIITIKKKAKR